MDAKETLAHAIIDASVGITQEHNGQFNYDYANTPGNWEYGCYQAVLAWINENIHFDTRIDVSDVSVNNMPDDVFTTSMENDAPVGSSIVEFTPSGGVQIEESVEWNVTAGVGFSITHSGEVSIQIPEIGGVSTSTSITFSGNLEVGRTTTHSEIETKQWGQKAEIPPKQMGEFMMIIHRKNIDAAFTATTTAKLNPGVVNTIAFASDGFQGQNTTKDFSWVLDNSKTWTHSGTLKAGKGMDVAVSFHLTPVSSVSNPAWRK